MTESLDTDAILLTAILNNDDPMKSRTYRGTAQYNDKELREAANALVMHHSQDVDSVAKGSRKRKIVDEDERAKNSRDRNREHAKNTRLRKKAYVSKLNDLVDQFKISRDMDTEERARIAIQLFNSQSQKKSVALLFLKYRCENTRSRLQWAAILDEDFKLTLPITPFRYFHKSEIRDGRRLLHGIDAVIADTASVNLMTESIGQGTSTWIESTKRDEFHKLLIESNPSDIVCSMNTVFCKFHFRLVNERTMTTVCHQAAMLNCCFDGHDKIVSAELVFDVMNFINQLQRVVGGSPEGSIVPNTLDMVLLESSEARLIVGKSPYRVMFANKAWTTLTGFTQSELEGNEFLSMFSEAQLDLPSIHGLVRGCVRAVPGRVILCGEGCKLFKQRPCGKCYLKMIPLTSSSSDVSHFLISLVSLE